MSIASREQKVLALIENYRELTLKLAQFRIDETVEFENIREITIGGTLTETCN